MAARLSEPPVPIRIPAVRRLHGEEVTDEFAWMQERDSQDVVDHLDAENDYTRERLAHTDDLQELLYREIKGRIKQSDTSVAVRKNGWWYWTETRDGEQYQRYCRGFGFLDANRTVVLDVNELARGHDYFALGAFDISPDHSMLAYSTDTDGSEQYTMRFRDLATGAELADLIPNTYYSSAWALDSTTFFYVVTDDAMRPCEVRRHQVGTSVDDDDVVYREDDERCFVGVKLSRSEDAILISSSSKLSDEVRLLDAAEPNAEPVLIWERRPEVEYSVEHHPDALFIVTNEDAPNGRLVRAAAADPTEVTDVLAYDDAVKIEGVDAFRHHLVLWSRKEGLSCATVLRLDPAGSGEVVASYDLGFDEPVYAIEPELNPAFETDTLRFTYTSLDTPTTIFAEDVISRSRKSLKAQPVLGGFDASSYETLREWATTPDGTRVPISLVRAKKASDDSPGPLLLYGYGSYEATIEPSFSSARLSLLERGFTFTIAHVRGGGELGRGWYDGGKMLSKANTFDDFVACAQHLVENGYTTPAQLVARGASAGGLLMGAVVNQHPGLFAAVVAEVPFVDVINTMLDTSLPLTVTEWEEWGNPRDAATYEYMRTYAPYENVHEAEYPAMLITAGLNDPRVQYWEPAKWAARLREHTKSDEPILLKTEMGAGHGGPSGRYDIWRDEALVYAFILDALELGETVLMR